VFKEGRVAEGRGTRCASSGWASSASAERCLCALFPPPGKRQKSRRYSVPQSRARRGHRGGGTKSL